MRKEDHHVSKRPYIHLENKLDRAVLRASVGRAALPQRRSAIYADAVGSASNLPGALAMHYADAVLAQRSWNAFHASMFASKQVCRCRPYRVRADGDRLCKKTAMCPACGARQFDELLDALRFMDIASVTASLMLSPASAPGAVTAMSATARELLRRANGRLSAFMPRLYPHQDKNTVVVAALLVVGDGNADVMRDGAHRLFPSTYATNEDGLVEFTRQFAAYPFKLLRMDPELVRNAYAALRGVRASITRKVDKHGLESIWERNARRQPPGTADVALAPGDIGGCLSRSDGGGGALHSEPAVVEIGG